MEIIPASSAPINPSSVEAYLDRVQFWLKDHIDTDRLVELRSQCGHLFFKNRPARFGQGYRQRIDLKQPSAEALQWIATREDALINCLEVALDLTFANWVELDEAKSFVDQHMVRRWHGRNQKIRIFEGGKKGCGRDTAYDGPRYAPNRRVAYKEAHCRLTGELYCLHIEWLVNGVEAIRRVGVSIGNDLVDFNHRKFWERRLLFYSVHIEKLGRRLRNYRTGGRSRTDKFGVDNRAGRALLYGSGGSVQELIDEWRHIGLERVFAPIEAQGWLPTSGQ